MSGIKSFKVAIPIEIMFLFINISNDSKTLIDKHHFKDIVKLNKGNERLLLFTFPTYIRKINQINAQTDSIA